MWRFVLCTANKHEASAGAACNFYLCQGFDWLYEMLRGHQRVYLVRRFPKGRRPAFHFRFQFDSWPRVLLIY